MKGQHPLEARAAMLADRLGQRVNDISQSLQAPGGRLLFHTPLSKANALNWWSQNRYNAIGQQAVSQMDPLTVAQLDRELTIYTQQQAALGQVPQGGINA